MPFCALNDATASFPMLPYKPCQGATLPFTLKGIDHLTVALPPYVDVLAGLLRRYLSAADPVPGQ
jgi:hypothetical protein